MTSSLPPLSAPPSFISIFCCLLQQLLASKAKEEEEDEALFVKAAPESAPISLFLPRPGAL